MGSAGVFEAELPNPRRGEETSVSVVRTAHTMKRRRITDPADRSEARDCRSWAVQWAPQPATLLRQELELALLGLSAPAYRSAVRQVVAASFQLSVYDVQQPFRALR